MKPNKTHGNNNRNSRLGTSHPALITRLLAVRVVAPVALTLILVSGLGHGVAYAADGDLDPDFGVDHNGKVTNDFEGNTDVVNAVAIQPDGKIVAAGYSISSGTFRFALARYTPDGALDPDFGSGGKVITSFGSPGGIAYDIAIQADGYIVVAGYAYVVTDDEFALVRYDPNGILDDSFGVAGMVTTDMCPGGIDRAHDVVIQPDGKIVAAGYACRPGHGDDFALARYTTNGDLDPDFGVDHNGKVFSDFFFNTDRINEVTLQLDGKIVAVGYATYNILYMALARYNADGSPDTNFSGDGLVYANFLDPYSNNKAHSVAIQPDGKIVVGGITTYTYDWFIVARFDANGTLDPDFGQGGYVTTNFGGVGNGTAYGVALQPDAKIVAVGWWRDSTISREYFALARYDPDGNPDSTFGNGGKVLTDFASLYQSAYSVAIQADGKIVAAGYTGFGTAGDFALARYLSAAPPPTLSPTPTPGGCTIHFSDVPPGSTFYDFVRCLACRNIVSGYADGTFRPGNNVTRGQLSKIVANAAGFSDPQPDQLFQDVAVGSTFHDPIGRLASRGYISGYSCGGAAEPCIPPYDLPYFRPNNNATRGQIAKIDSNAALYSDPPAGQQFEDVAVASTYYTYTYRLVSRSVMSGYPCGAAGEPCVPPSNLPYFRPFNNATRGQTSKIVANTFFPGCSTPADMRR
jgi:uncharacterized delta-60 repeat protein